MVRYHTAHSLLIAEIKKTLHYKINHEMKKNEREMNDLLQG